MSGDYATAVRHNSLKSVKGLTVYAITDPLDGHSTFYEVLAEANAAAQADGKKLNVFEMDVLVFGDRIYPMLPGHALKNTIVIKWADSGDKK